MVSFSDFCDIKKVPKDPSINLTLFIGIVLNGKEVTNKLAEFSEFDLISIGRNSGNSISFIWGHISSKHAVIMLVNNRIYWRCLDTTNSTNIDGKEYKSGEIEIQKGSVIACFYTANGEENKEGFQIQVADFSIKGCS